MLALRSMFKADYEGRTALALLTTTQSLQAAPTLPPIDLNMASIVAQANRRCRT